MQESLKVESISNASDPDPANLTSSRTWQKQNFLTVFADSGSDAFLTPGSGMLKKNQDPGWTSLIFKEFCESFLWCESGIFLTLDTGWKSSNPGSRIRDKHLHTHRTDLARSTLIKEYLPNETIPYPENQCWGSGAVSTRYGSGSGSFHPFSSIIKQK